MKKKEEIKYLDKEWKKMHAHLEAFLASGDQEELHQFRVQIKKLNAMLTLFERASRQHGLLKNFKPVRKIFKHAGQIRDAHTNLQLSARFGVNNNAFQASQQQIIEEGTSDFRQKGEKYLKNIKASYKHIKKQLGRIDDNAIAAYYKRQLEQIAEALETPKFTDEMHNNRKLIKILVYNHKLANKALGGALLFNTEYLDRLQSRLGEWHDNVVAAQLFASPELNDKPVVTLINKINAGVKRAIKSLATDFMKKATAVEVAAKFN